MFQLWWRSWTQSLELARDQISIAQNKAKFQEERNCCSGDGCSNGNCTCGSQHDSGHGNYERNKLEVAKNASLNYNGVQCVDEFCMAYCGKYQTLRHLPNAHTTGFHDATLLAGTSYHFPSTHPLYHHCTSTPPSSTPNGHGALVPVLNTAASILGGIEAKNNLI